MAGRSGVTTGEIFLLLLPSLRSTTCLLYVISRLHNYNDLFLDLLDDDATQPADLKGSCPQKEDGD
jgi:hypothetical protein